MDELIKALRTLQERIALFIASVHLPAKETRLKELSAELADPDIWKDAAKAQRIAREASMLEKTISAWRSLERRTVDLLSFAADDKTDQSVNFRVDITSELAKLEQELSARELEVLLQGMYDEVPAIVTIYSGAGGVDAQDWAEMLSRMYLRFASESGWSTRILQRTAGQEAGIKNITIRFEGPYAYGYLRAESGVHRLVRISPYDADQARHTSFAMVEVLPELEEPTTITVDKDDVRVDVFRSSGHGGQSVNTTDSAVRLTHIPTGITTSCQNERSQMQNKEQAWKMLLGKLERYYQAQREEERQLLRGELTENAWGSQIRSYVLHPYKMVKDHRTKFESKDPDAVLNGAVMPFIEAELRRLASEQNAS